MKKTLITLAAFALASVASAAWTDVAVISYSHVNPSHPDWNPNIYQTGSYSFDFVISADALLSGTDFLAYYGGEHTSGDNTQISFTLTAVAPAEPQGVTTYTLTIGRSATYTSTTDSVPSWNDEISFKGLTAGKYSVSSVGGGSATVTVTPDGGSALSAVNGDATHENMLQFPDIGNPLATTGTLKLNTAYAVPEPATATLSLLALAGLAARRRRK